MAITQSDFNTFLQTHSNEPETVQNVRKKAFDSFLKVGYPTSKHENWQYINLAQLSKTNYQLPNVKNSKFESKILDNYLFEDSYRIVFINGKLDINNSELKELSKHISIKNISSTSSIKFESKDDNPFVLLNKAFYSGGYFIEIDSNAIINTPLYILNIISNDQANTQFHFNNLIKVENNCQLTIIEETINVSINNFINSVNNIFIDQNSQLNHILIQQENPTVNKLNYSTVYQQDDSSYLTQIFSTGGNLIRNEIQVQLNGENCSSSVSGLSLSSEKQHIENYTVVNHNKPNSNSQQLFKNILTDSSNGVFNGLVRVQPNAQQTDSKQTNKNILLSKKALMNSNPQLEIYADDVKCAHGSATGELDEDSIFYMRSRGIDVMTAKSLLIEGFAKEVIDQVKIDSVKERLNNILIEWLKRQEK